MFLIVTMIFICGHLFSSSPQPDLRPILGEATPHIVSSWKEIPALITNMLDYTPSVSLHSDDFNQYIAQGNILDGFLVFSATGFDQMIVQVPNRMQSRHLGVHRSLSIHWFFPEGEQLFASTRDDVIKVFDKIKREHGLPQKSLFFLGQSPLGDILGGLGWNVTLTSENALFLKDLGGQGTIVVKPERILTEEAVMISSGSRLAPGDLSRYVLKAFGKSYSIIVINPLSPSRSSYGRQQPSYGAQSRMFEAPTSGGTYSSGASTPSYKPQLRINEAPVSGGTYSSGASPSYNPQPPRPNAYAPGSALAVIKGLGRLSSLSPDDVMWISGVVAYPDYLAHSGQDAVREARRLLNLAGISTDDEFFEYLPHNIAMKRCLDGKFLEGMFWIASGDPDLQVRGLRKKAFQIVEGNTITAILPVDYIVLRPFVVEAAKGLTVGFTGDYDERNKNGFEGSAIVPYNGIKDRLRNGNIGQGVVIVQGGRQVAIGSLEKLTKYTYKYNRVVFVDQGKVFSALFVTPFVTPKTSTESYAPPPMGNVAQPYVPQAASADYKPYTPSAQMFYGASTHGGENDALSRILSSRPLSNASITMHELASFEGEMALPDTGFSEDNADPIFDAAQLKPAKTRGAMNHGIALRKLQTGAFLGGIAWIDTKPFTRQFRGVRMETLGPFGPGGYYVTAILPADETFSSTDIKRAVSGMKVAYMGERPDGWRNAITYQEAKQAMASNSVGRGLMIIQKNKQINLDEFTNDAYYYTRVIVKEANPGTGLYFHHGQRMIKDSSPLYSAVFVTPKNPSLQKPFAPRSSTYSDPTVPQQQFAPQPTYSDPTFVSQQQFAPQPTYSDPTFVPQQSFSAQQQFAPQPTYMPVLSAQELTTLRKEELIQRKGIQLAIGNPARGAEVIKKITTQLQLSNPSVITQTKADDLLKNGEFLDGMVWIGKGRELSTEWKGIRRVDMGNFKGYTLTGVMPSDPELTQQQFMDLARAFGVVYADHQMGVPVQPFEVGRSAIIANNFSAGVVLVQPKRQIPLRDFSGGGYNLSRFVLRRGGQTHSVVVVARQ